MNNMEINTKNNIKKNLIQYIGKFGDKIEVNDSYFSADFFQYNTKDKKIYPDGIYVFFYRLLKIVATQKNNGIEEENKSFFIDLKKSEDRDYLQSLLKQNDKNNKRQLFKLTTFQRYNASQQFLICSQLTLYDCDYNEVFYSNNDLLLRSDKLTNFNYVMTQAEKRASLLTNEDDKAKTIEKINLALKKQEKK